MSVSLFADSEIHGLQHIARADSTMVRRTIWAGIFLLSLAGFCLFASFRVSYFLTYPYATHTYSGGEKIPIPAVAICIVPDEPYTLPLPVSQWANLSDGDVVIYAEFAYGITVTRVDEATNQLYIDDERIQYLEALNTSTLEQVVTLEADKGVWPINPNRRFSQMFMSLDDMQAFISRLASIARGKPIMNLSIGGVELLPKTYGGRDQFILVVGRTGLGGGSQGKEYTSYLTTTITEYGLCYVLDSTQHDQLDLHYKKSTDILIVNDSIMFLISRGYDQKIYAGLTMYIYEPGGSPSAFQPMIYTSLLGIAPGIIHVSGSYEKRILSTPYHAEECNPENFGQCLMKCWSWEHGCSQAYFPESYGKPLCNLNEQLIYSLDAVCNEECAPPCTTHSFTIDESYYQDTKSEEKLVSVLLMAGSQISHHASKEEPIYTYDALLSELGGMLGLFIGASALSLIHLVETLVFMICMKQQKQKNEIITRL